MILSPALVHLPSVPFTLPLEIDNGFLTVNANFNGAYQEPFIIDTGSPYTAFKEGAFGHLSMPQIATSLPIGGSDGTTVAGSVYRDCTLGLETALFKHFDVLSINMSPSLTSHSRRPFVGILGWSLFANVLLTIDLSRSQVMIEPGELPPCNGADVLPLYRVNFELEMPATIDGKNVLLLFDTGSVMPENVIVSPEVGSGLRWAYPPEPIVAETIAHEVAETSATIHGDLVIGRYVIKSPLVARSPNGSNAVGMATLRHFIVTLDVKHNRIRLSGPIDAPIGSNRLVGEGDWEESAEQIRNPKRFQDVEVNSEAVGKDVHVKMEDNAKVIVRPDGNKLLLMPSGMLCDLAREYQPSSGTHGSLKIKDQNSVTRWYEHVMPVGAGTACQIVTLNPIGCPEYRYIEDANRGTTTIWHGITILERPDGSSHTELRDGLTLDWSASGHVVIGWPDHPPRK